MRIKSVLWQYPRNVTFIFFTQHNFKRHLHKSPLICVHSKKELQFDFVVKKVVRALSIQFDSILPPFSCKFALSYEGQPEYFFYVETIT